MTLGQKEHYELQKVLDYIANASDAHWEGMLRDAFDRI
jgi:hypothetical protein